MTDLDPNYVPDGTKPRDQQTPEQQKRRLERFIVDSDDFEWDVNPDDTFEPTQVPGGHQN